MRKKCEGAWSENPRAHLRATPVTSATPDSVMRTNVVNTSGMSGLRDGSA